MQIKFCWRKIFVFQPPAPGHAPRRIWRAELCDAMIRTGSQELAPPIVHVSSVHRSLFTDPASALAEHLVFVRITK
jgi:hypothetical protein